MTCYSIPASGHPIYFREVLRALANSHAAPPFTGRLFPGESSVTVSSGSAALLLSFRALRRASPRREIVLPAYTCPSVLAAVLNAGLQPLLCDFDYPRLHIDLDHLKSLVGPETLAIVAVHLYGTRERTHALKKVAYSCGAFLVEDSAQLFSPPGSAPGLEGMGENFWDSAADGLSTHADLVIVSFGRGKPITLLSGGGVRILNPELEEPVREEFESMRAPSLYAKAGYLAKLPLYSLLFHPRLFWMPYNLPFLKIGTTTFTLQVSYRRSNPLADRLGNAVVHRLYRLPETTEALSSLYAVHLQDAENDLDYMPEEAFHPSLLRFPIVFRSHRHREMCLTALNREGLGASPSYPAPLNELNGVPRRLFGEAVYPRARALSRRILTLPIHECVKEKDILRMTQIIHHYISTG